MFFKKKNKMQCNASAAAGAGALTAALFMLVLSLLNAAGLYTSATAQMMKWHMFYTPDVQGTILGMLEAAIITYIVIWVFLWCYEALNKKSK